MKSTKEFKETILSETGAMDSLEYALFSECNKLLDKVYCSWSHHSERHPGNLSTFHCELKWNKGNGVGSL